MFDPDNLTGMPPISAAGFLVVTDPDKYNFASGIFQTLRIFFSLDLCDCPFRAFLPFQLHHKGWPARIMFGQIDNVCDPFTDGSSSHCR